MQLQYQDSHNVGSSRLVMHEPSGETLDDNPLLHFHLLNSHNAGKVQHKILHTDLKKHILFESGVNCFTS